MQILFKHSPPKHPFWRKKHSRQRIVALAVRLENHKNVVFRCANATFAHPKCHFRRVQVPFSSTLSATSTQYSRWEYWSLAARVLEFSSTSTQCKCHNSTCFWEITPQPIKYQRVTFLILSPPPKLAKNAPTICFLIFRALLSGQTYKYCVRAKGVPRTRGKVLHSQEPTEEHTQQRTTISRSCLYLCVDNKLSHPFAVFALLKHIPKRMI